MEEVSSKNFEMKGGQQPSDPEAAELGSQERGSDYHLRRDEYFSDPDTRRHRDIEPKRSEAEGSPTDEWFERDQYFGDTKPDPGEVDDWFERDRYFAEIEPEPETEACSTERPLRGTTFHRLTRHRQS